MKKATAVLLLFVILLVFQFTQAQSIKISPTPINDKGYDYSKVLGHNDNGFYVLQSTLSFDIANDRIGFKVRRYNIMFFGMDLKLQWQKAVDNTLAKKKLVGIYYFNYKPLLVYAEKLEDEMYNVYFQYMSSAGTFALNDSERISVRISEAGTFERVNGTPSFYHEKFCLLLPEHNAHYQQYNLIVCDTSLQHIALRMIKVDKSDDYFSAEEFDVSDDGDLAISGLMSNDKKIRNAKDFGNVTYQCYLLPADTLLSVVYDFKVPQKNIGEATILFDNDNRQLVVCGFFEDSATQTNTGIAYARYNAANPQSATIKCYTVKKPATEVMGEKLKDGLTSLAQYTISKLILRSDSGIMLVAEDFYKEEFSFYDYFTQTFQRRFEYHYDNMIVMNINGDGVEEWNRLVRKEQTSTNDDAVYLSCLIANTKGKLFLFYNRDVSLNNEVIAISLASDGTVRHSDLLRANDHVLIMPRFGRQISPTELVVPVIQRKKMHLAKITVE